MHKGHKKMNAKHIRLSSMARSLGLKGRILVAACVTLLLCVSMGSAIRAFAAPGDLDPTFGTGGLVANSFGSSYSYGAWAIALQPDGKIVAVGDVDLGSTGGDFAVMRLNPDGTLDSTFDGDGKVTTDFLGYQEAGRAVAIQNDGKIVVGGTVWNASYANFGLVRYNTNGSLDTSFNGTGKVITDWGLAASIRSLAIQSDGKIVVSGNVSRHENDFAAARYNTNGSLDTSFKGTGKVSVDFGGQDSAAAMSIQPNGKIVLAGDTFISTNAGSVQDFALARLNMDGSLDTTFSGDGKRTTDFFGLHDYISAVAIQSDGKIVAAGTIQASNTGDNFGLARYNTDGTLDTSFSGNGKTYTDFGSSDQAFGIAIQSNGKIVVVGSTWGTGDDIALARYNTGGALDPGFSGDGKVTTDYAGHSNGAHAVAIQPDGKIVIAGWASISGTSESDSFGLARYQGIVTP